MSYCSNNLVFELSPGTSRKYHDKSSYQIERAENILAGKARIAETKDNRKADYSING